MVVAKEEEATPGDDVRVQASAMVRVQICERRAGVPPAGEPFGKPLIEFKLPRNMRRCLEDAVVFVTKGRPGLNVTFDGRLVSVRSEKPPEPSLIVVDDQAVENLTVRLEGLRAECARYEALAEANADAHRRMVALYASEQARIMEATKVAQDQLEAMRRRAQEEGSLRTDSITALAKAERTIAQGLADRVALQEANLRSACEAEAKYVNLIGDMTAEAQAKKVARGGKVVEVVDGLIDTGTRVLDHKLVARLANGFITQFFGPEVPEPPAP